MRNPRPADHGRAQLGAGDLGLLAGQEQEHVQAVRAQVPEAAAGLGGIEHPRAVPAGVPRGSGPVDPHIDVRERPEASLGQELAGARRERLVALGEGDGGERAEPGGLVGHRVHLGGADPHGLFYAPRIVYLVLATFQEAMLGLILTVVPWGLYPSYALAPRVVALSAQQDQAWGGIVMWGAGRARPSATTPNRLAWLMLGHEVATEGPEPLAAGSPALVLERCRARMAGGETDETTGEDCWLRYGGLGCSSPPGGLA